MLDLVAAEEIKKIISQEKIDPKKNTMNRSKYNFKELYNQSNEAFRK